MDPRRFDSLARSLAAPKTRRGLLGALAALAAGLAARGAVDAQVTQAQCGNKICASNLGVCSATGCVCCVWGNGNNRCVPPGSCTGTVTSPTTTTTPAPTTTTTTTTTAAPTTTTTAAPPVCEFNETNCGGICTDTRSDSANCGGCGTACPAITGVTCQSRACCQESNRGERGGAGGVCSAEVPCCAPPSVQLCQGGFCCLTSGRFCGSNDIGQCCDGLVCSFGACVAAT